MNQHLSTFSQDSGKDKNYCSRLRDLKDSNRAIGNDGAILFCFEDSRYGRGRFLLIVTYSLLENSHSPDKPTLRISYHRLENEEQLYTSTEPIPFIWEEKLHIDTYQELMHSNGKWMVWNPAYNLPGMFQQAVGLLNGHGLTDLQKELALETQTEQKDQQSLVVRHSAEQLGHLLDTTQKRSEKLQVINQFMQIEMGRRMAVLQAVQNQAKGLLATLVRKVERIMRMITRIELYMGIEEELHQLQSGTPAPAELPITFRQRTLFMDEEIAVRIGFKQAKEFDVPVIESFDEWLLEPGNLDYIMPETRGIVALKARRSAKEYTQDTFINSLLNRENLLNTYFLIRNGENVYRIYTAKLALETKLFPDRLELALLFEKMEKAKSDSDKDKLEKESFIYQKLVTFLQGLLDRTTVFGQVKEPINLFKLTEKTEQLIQFIYDDEYVIGDGRPQFRDWVKLVNTNLTTGDRVILSGIYSRHTYQSPRNFKNRLFYHCNENNVPPLPPAGLYQVEKAPGGYKWSFYENPPRLKTLCIRYNPKDTVYGGWTDDYDPHSRLNRIAWALDPDNDTFLINYDAVNLDDVHYYLYNRQHRQDYLHMLPVLEELLSMSENEAKLEAPFVAMVLEEATRQAIACDQNLVKQAVKWWKTKNKWKRAIEKDNSKAFRMILRRLISSHSA